MLDGELGVGRVDRGIRNQMEKSLIYRRLVPPTLNSKFRILMRGTFSVLRLCLFLEEEKKEKRYLEEITSKNENTFLRAPTLFCPSVLCMLWDGM